MTSRKAHPPVDGAHVPFSSTDEGNSIYRAIVEATNDGVWVTDLERRTTFVNRRMADMLGCEPEDMIGKPASDFVPEDYHDQLSKNLALRAQGVSGQAEYRLRHRNKTYFWVLSNSAPLLDERGAVVGALVTLTDITEQKNAQEAIKESEERYRALTEGSLQGIGILQDDRVVFVNQAFAVLLGYNPNEIIGRPVDDFVAPSFRKLMSERRQTRLSGGEISSTFEFQVLHRDGSEIWVEQMSQIIQWDNRPAVQVSVIDITKRKTDEERLDRLATAMDQMSEMVALYDSQDRLVTFNKPFKEFNEAIEELVVPGTSFEELARAAASKGIRSSVDENGRDWLTERLERHRNPAGAFQLERPRGGWDLIHEQRLADGGIVTIVSDITPLKRAEESLRESEGRFRRLFDNAEISIWDEDFGGAMRELSKLRDQGVTDLEAYLTENAAEAYRLSALVQINSVNDATLALYGVASKEEFIDSLDAIMTEDTIHGFIGVLDAMWSGDPYYSTEVSHTTVDGRDITVIVSVPIPQDEAEYDHVPVCVLDITEQKKAEQAIVAAKEEAEYANRTKSEFLANMSHELRTPLNAILGFAQIIRDQTFGAATDRYIDYANDIHGSGEHLLEIINDLLDLSKIEAGKADVNEGVFALDGAIHECVSIVAGRADESRLTLEAKADGNAVEILADERMFKQMLLNLLSNAIKFTRPGGRIGIDVERRTDGSLGISVSDSGIGIEKQDIALVMSPFGQIANVLTRDHVGTGLGLPLVSSLAELHGGKLELTSEVGVGTTATVWLPPERTFPMS